jgi:hypothetical protein
MSASRSSMQQRQRAHAVPHAPLAAVSETDLRRRLEVLFHLTIEAMGTRNLGGDFVRQAGGARTL